MVIQNPPNDNSGGIYTGNLFVLDTSGGFSLTQGLPQINLNTMSPITQYDVTDAIQIYFSVRTINDKIGIYKDASNQKVVQLLFDLSTDSLLFDNATINKHDFLQNVTADKIISLGSISTLYSDFDQTVQTYFGDPYGFSTFFAAEDYFVNGGVFDASAFAGIINGFTFNIAGSYVTDLSGTVTINDLNNHLRYITAANPFNNRPTADNYDITEGFVEGDLIFIPNGIQIKLTVDIQAESFVNITNMGPGNLAKINNAINYNNIQTGVSKVTNYSNTNITQIYNVPILLVLSNVDTLKFNDFGNNFGIALNIKENWLAICMSSTGQFQTAIEEFGNIYVSTDYGQTWNINYNIGNAMSNCVGMSETGKYQTASNGVHIYTSNNYGATWMEVYSLGSSNVFVCISLNGRYQTVVSCGDTIYQSRNFGLTWENILTDPNSDLYNSIETFPTAGCAMSFTGEIQVIASENIYLSTNFGHTWNPIFTDDDFIEKNWDSIAISSDGSYQTALDSGGDIYVSSDTGNTWNMVNDPNLLDKEWQTVFMSAGGQFQTVLNNGGNVYKSTTYGVSWTQSTSNLTQNKNWQCGAISANGVYQTIAEFGGYIYTSILI
jgi:photosystem II stability/assembly factor-like uncharacterized protein